jgi:hypothetical protein
VRISSEKSCGCSHAAKWPPVEPVVVKEVVGIGALRPPRRADTTAKLGEVRLRKADLKRRDGTLDRLLTGRDTQMGLAVFRAWLSC